MKNAKKRRQNENFLGWKVVGGCFCLMFFATAVIGNTAALFMDPICSEFGFETAKYSVTTLIGSLTGAIAAIMLAPKMQEGNIKKILISCAIVAGISYSIMGLCKQLWQFFVVFGICNFALGGLSQLPVSLLITKWFEDKRSIAMSIAFSGTGLGGTFWSLAFGRIIVTSGWKYCYFLGGIAVILFVTLAVIFLIKKDPKYYGQKPYTEEKNGENINKNKKEVWLGIEKSLAIKTSYFTMLSVAMFLLGTIAAGIATHSVNYLINIGWEMSKAAGVLSVFSLVNVVGMFLGGFLFEKLGPKGGTLVSVILTIIGLISLIMAKNHIFGYIYAVSFALAMMLPKMLPALVTSHVFGLKDYGAIYSYLNIFLLIGCSLGGVITGIINDKIGYTTAWIFYILIAVLVFVFTYMAISSSNKIKEKYEIK